MSINNVQNTHIHDQLRDLHRALLEIVGVMNRPQRDEAMIKASGITLDRALFPLLVLAERLSPVGVVELADRLGRDHTTVSRQVTKMENLGLVTRQANASDKRIREVVIAGSGQQLVERIDEARLRIGQTIFSQWEDDDIATFARLMLKFAQDIQDDPS